MLYELKMEANRTFTENGGAAFRSTGNHCLDLFSFAGAFRQQDEGKIIHAFTRAYAENPDYAMKILFYARDIREGLGEKRFFRVALRYAAAAYPASVIRNIPLIAEYGRFDDLLSLLYTPCEEAVGRYIKSVLQEDMDHMAAGQPISLLGKWLPSVNTTSSDIRKAARQVCTLLGLSEKKYRKLLSELRSYIDILEKHLCRKDYTFDYEKQPSKALFTYRKAFYRNDKERYLHFLDAVREGKATLKTSSLYPYDIVRVCDEYSRFERGVVPTKDDLLQLDTTWRSLTDFDNHQNALAVVDGSGSMYVHYADIRPIDIAISLGIYFAEHTTGAFANHFITFSETPRLIELKGRNIYEKVRYCQTFHEVANTNIAAVFDMILHTAVKHHLPPQELPETLYIISDMEFDEQEDNDCTVFAYAKKKYARYGYRLPTVVFWNVDARTEQHPVRCDETGAVLVSGASPSLFRYALDNHLDPVKMMLSIIDSERYRPIAA